MPSWRWPRHRPRFDRASRRFKSYVATDASLGAQVAARKADEKRVAAQLAAAQARLRARPDRPQAPLQALVESGSVSARN